MEENTTQTVTVTVAGHELHNGKPMHKLDIPAWGSKFPIPLYGISPEAQALLPIGDTLDVVLQADRLKDGTDGNKQWNWFWSFVRLAGAEDRAEEPPVGAPAVPSGAQEVPREEAENPAPYYPPFDREAAIRRSVALKAAVDYVGGNPTMSQSVEAALGVADEFDKWLQGPVGSGQAGRQEVPAQPASAQPPPAARRQTAAPASTNGNGKATVGTLMYRAQSEMGLDSRTVLGILNVENPSDIKDLKAAWGTLQRFKKEMADASSR